MERDPSSKTSQNQIEAHLGLGVDLDFDFHPHVLMLSSVTNGNPLGQALVDQDKRCLSGVFRPRVLLFPPMLRNARPKGILYDCMYAGGSAMHGAVAEGSGITIGAVFCQALPCVCPSGLARFVLPAIYSLPSGAPYRDVTSTA